MKRSLTLLFGILLFWQASAQVEFIRSQDWEAIKADAAKQKKLIFIDAYTDWCGWCKVMDKKTFSDPAIGNMMNHNFVNVKLEMEKEDLGIQMARKFTVNSFPSYLVFNPEGELVYVTTGFQEPGAFMQTLFEIINPNKHVKRPGYTSSMNLEYPKMYLNAMGENGKRKFPKEKEVKEWVKDHRDLTEEINWAVYQRFIYQMEEEDLNLFWKNKELLDSLYGRDLVNRVGESILSKEITFLAENSKEKEFETLMKNKAPKVINVEEDGFFYRIYFYKKAGIWAKYRSIMQDYFTLKGMHDAEFWNNQAWEVYEKCNDSLVIQDALVWIEQAAGESGDYNHLDTYAALLFKAGQLEDAKKKAELAISTGKAAGKNVKGTEDLLEKIEGAMKEKEKEKE